MKVLEKSLYYVQRLLEEEREYWVETFAFSRRLVVCAGVGKYQGSVWLQTRKREADGDISIAGFVHSIAWILYTCSIAVSFVCSIAVLLFNSCYICCFIAVTRVFNSCSTFVCNCLYSYSIIINQIASKWNSFSSQKPLINGPHSGLTWVIWLTKPHTFHFIHFNSSLWCQC